MTSDAAPDGSKNDGELRLAAIEARLRLLELSRIPAPVLPPAIDASIIETLRSHAASTDEKANAYGGGVMYAGAVTTPGGEYVWQVERPVAGLMGVSVEQIAQVLSALGSEPRLQIVRALIAGPRTSQQLQDVLGGASPGQLYHHLKELIAAGVIEHRGRADYRLSPRKIVPLLVVMATAYDLGGSDVTNER